MLTFNTKFFVDEIKALNLPVVMYGTGNGAEKLYYELKKYGIYIADIFASDNFKGGKQFLGHKVLHFEDVKKLHKEFIIVLGFATDREEMFNTVKSLKALNNGGLYMPEVPVFDNGFFTPELLNARKTDIEKLYTLLADEQSKKVLEGIINFKLSGNIDELFNIETNKSEVYSLLNLKENEVYVDGGAYNGDTVKEFLSFSKNPKQIIAIEPAPKNAQKLKKYAQELYGVNISVVEAALSDECKTVFLSDKSGRSPSITPGGKYEVKTITIDSLNIKPTFIKLDVEGEEMATLLGGINTITTFTPKLAVSLYHRLQDFINIPLYINKICPEYKLYLRHHPYLPSWETNLYAIK